MVRLTGACAGLLAFSVAILRGLSVGNPARVILERAILALILFCIIGMILGRISRVVILEYALNKEKEIMARFRGNPESADSDDAEAGSLGDGAANSTPPKSEPIGA